jgi:hypothetical protein
MDTLFAGLLITAVSL